jgi:hypothetical protein
MCQTCKAVPYRSLPFLDGVLLWTMRAWVLGIREKIPVEEQIQDAFGKLGAPDATGPLFGFMWCLGHGALRALDVHCVCVPDVGSDERCLIDILALTQQARRFEALLLLRSLIRPKAAIAARDAAGSVAASLTAAGRILQPRQMDTSRHVLAPEERHRGTIAPAVTLH